MKKMRKYALIVVVACCFVGNVFALDANEAVKVLPLLKTSASWDGQPIVYPQGKVEITAMWIEIAPDAETGWHTHAVPSFAVMLEGELEVFLKDGKSKKLRAGDVLVEVVNTLHIGRNMGSVPVRLVVFYTGIEGVAHSAKARSESAEVGAKP